MPFVDPDSVQVLTTADPVTLSWLETIAENQNYFNNPPRVKVYRNADVDIPNDDKTMVLWNAEEWDTDTMHSTSTNTSRLVATTAGRYEFSCRIVLAANSTGFRRLRIWKNGDAGTLVDAEIDNAPNAGSFARLFCSSWINLAAGDYIEAEVYQNSGGDLAVKGAALGTSERSWFGMQWQGTD
jgi:hypothetical protein